MRSTLDIQQEKNTFSALALVLVFISCCCLSPFLINWGNEHHPFVMDVDQYYSYLYATFINHDLSTNPHSYWLMETPTHHLVPKVTYGMGLAYLPFYLLAKCVAPAGSTGYEPVYAYCIHYGCMLYAFLGLVFCRKTLLMWFSDKVTAATLTLLFFGTNLFCYTLIDSEAVHGVLFFLIAVFVYCSMRWSFQGHLRSFYGLVLIGGIIVLIRPSEILVFLIPLLLNVSSIGGFRQKFRQIGTLKWRLVVGVILFMLPLTPQLIYWKIQSGGFLFFSYGSSEGFFWSDPKFYSVLLGYRKGWLVYTPLMIFALIGFMFLYRKHKGLFYPALLYTLLNLYVVSAWWDWGYGGAFGMRALVQCYAVLVWPLAAMVEQILNWWKAGVAQRSVSYMLSAILVFCCVLNLFQSNLYKHRILHYDSMTREAYWFTFFKKHYSEDELRYLPSLMKHPDYAAMRKGARDE